MPLLISILPPYFQHDPLGLFLVLSATATLAGVLTLWIASKLLP